MTMGRQKSDDEKKEEQNKGRAEKKVLVAKSAFQNRGVCEEGRVPELQFAADP
jgi:hypothetical protein